MAITGAVAAAIRRDDPYGDWIAMGARLIGDPGGFRTGGRPYYWMDGQHYRRFKDIPGAVVQRASEAWDRDGGGLWCRSAPGEARETALVGLGVEEARVNLVARPSLSDNVGWQDTGVVSVPGSTWGPFSSVIIGSGGQSWHRRETQTSIALTAGTVYAYRAYVRSGNSGRARLVLRNFTDSIESVVAGPLWGLAVTSVAAGVVTHAARAMGDGVIEIAGTFTPGASGNYRFGVGPDSIVAGQAIEAFFFEVQPGNFITSPMPANGVMATRYADNVYIDNLGPLMAAPFCLAVGATAAAVDGASRDLASLSVGGGPANTLRISRAASNQVLASLAAEGVTQVTSNAPGGPYVGALNLAAVNRLLPGENRMALNGALGAANAITAPTGMNRLSLGSNRGGSAWLNGLIRPFALFGYLSNEQLVRLSQ